MLRSLRRLHRCHQLDVADENMIYLICIAMNDTDTQDKPPVADGASSFLTNLRRLGFVEGVSTLVLFGIAMPLKYLAGLPLAVRIAGTLHGILFVGLALMLMIAVSRVPITRWMAIAGIAAAVVPFGPFVYDRWLVKLDSEGLSCSEN
jgi:integral membrane protein